MNIPGCRKAARWLRLGVEFDGVGDLNFHLICQGIGVFPVEQVMNDIILAVVQEDAFRYTAALHGVHKGIQNVIGVRLALDDVEAYGSSAPPVHPSISARAGQHGRRGTAPVHPVCGYPPPIAGWCGCCRNRMECTVRTCPCRLSCPPSRISVSGAGYSWPAVQRWIRWEAPGSERPFV